jgi:hypothetical protein
MKYMSICNIYTYTKIHAYVHHGCTEILLAINHVSIDQKVSCSSSIGADARNEVTDMHLIP